MDYGFQVLSGFQSLSVEIKFWILILSTIPDSLSCFPDFTSKNFTDSGIQIPLHGVGGGKYNTK